MLNFTHKHNEVIELMDSPWAPASVGDLRLHGIPELVSATPVTGQSAGNRFQHRGPFDPA
jgi:hypothetical protein